jgi:hypothetical protein
MHTISVNTWIKMKKILVLTISLFFIPNSIYATPSIDNFKINNKNKIYSKRNVNYFTNQGYEIVLQETRGTTTGYVLKKDEDYVGCRAVGLSKEQTCYIIDLIKAK